MRKRNESPRFMFYFQPDDLLKQFERLNKDPRRFIHWMKGQCQANAGHARKTFGVVSGLLLDEKPTSPSGNRKMDEIKRENGGDGRKKFTISTPKSLLNSLKAPNTKINGKMSNNNEMKLQAPTFPLAASKVKVIDQRSDSVMNSAATKHDVSNENEDVAKDALNQHLSKLRNQFSNMHDTANQKMLELQSELGKMQHMSHEFDVLAEFLTSEEKLSIFEQNLDCLQKTVRLTEEKIHEINTNNQKMSRMIRQITETTKKQHENNYEAIVAIGDRLARWELKLDRVTRKITNQRIHVDDTKLNRGGDGFGQLKDDIENVLNSRLAEVSTDMENMKSVVICIISLIVLKMFVFDLFKNDIIDKLTE